MSDFVTEYAHPVMVALLPHRKARRQEIGVVERAKRNGDEPVEFPEDAVMNGRAAVGAELMDDLVAAVRKVCPCFD
jgi:hypothetical protein